MFLHSTTAWHFSVITLHMSLCVCHHVYLCACLPWREEPQYRQMVVRRVCRVFTAYFRPPLCSVAHAAALKHSFVCDMRWGYSGAIHSSAAIFIHARVYGVTWVVWSWFPAPTRWALIWSTLSSRLSGVPSHNPLFYNKMFSERSISCSSVKLWPCVIS